MKRLLFVCYGSGHVRMVLPVARALQQSGRVQVQVLGLTTAAGAVREAGLPLLQIKNFVGPGDQAALALGQTLAAALGPLSDEEESAAYLGLCYAELQREVGADQAQERYQRDGRQAFLPEQLLGRILKSVQPDLLVATNSPRAERAAILAARRLGIPAVCLVDLFAYDEVRWIGAPDYADRVCVLNPFVKDFLVAAGRSPDHIVVTGNPAFDALRAPGLAEAGRALRAEKGWGGRRVLLWPTQVEPALHPFNGSPGDPALPGQVLARLLQWTLQQSDAVLCVRPRVGEAPPELPDHPAVVLAGQEWALPPLLHAVDAVVTLSSTVGLEGHLAGARLVQVLGSVFDPAMPLARFGIADAAVPLAGLDPALDHWSAAGRRLLGAQEPSATERVLAVLDEFL